MTPLSKMIIALVVALSVYVAIQSVPVIVAGLAAIAVSLIVPLVFLYITVKIVKLAWKH